MNPQRFGIILMFLLLFINLPVMPEETESSDLNTLNSYIYSPYQCNVPD